MTVDLKKEFPILERQIKGQPLVYLDNAATSLTPVMVTEAMNRYYHQMNANIHRGVHQLSQEATMAYEEVRSIVKEFINAGQKEEIVYTSGTTDSINLVAYGYGLHHFKPGDEIIVSQMEHHSNLVPWHLITRLTGAVIKAINLTPEGTLDLEHYRELLSDKTKLVSVLSVSNTLGTVNPIKEIVSEAKRVGALTLIDAAQSISHFPIDVQELGVDFLVFGGHKMFGPTGIGILYGRKEVLDTMAPYKGGGSMITSVTVDDSEYLEAPQKFEAGTPPIAEVIGLGAAIDFIKQVGWETLMAHDRKLVKKSNDALLKLPFVKVFGPKEEKVATVSLVVDKVHPHDVGTILDDQGIAVRTGHHCTEPIMKYFKIPATIRISMSIYNTEEDIDKLVTGLKKAYQLFQG